MAEKVDLDKIVGELDPDKINEKVELKHREARNKFEVKDIKAKGYKDFKKRVTEYVQHHHKEVYGSEMPEELAFSKAMGILEKKYEKEGGFTGAVAHAKKGKMNDVLSSLSDALESEHRGAYVQHVMSEIDPQDFDTHVRLVDQYKKKYEGLLPKDMKKKSSEELAKNYPGLIQHHINVVESAKSELKKYEPEEKKAA